MRKVVYWRRLRSCGVLRELQARKAELDRQQEVRAIRRWDTPGELAAALDATTVQTPALDVIDEALASELLDAARELRTAGRQATHWARESAAARRRVNKAITAAAKNELVLADEMAIARRALAETED